VRELKIKRKTFEGRKAGCLDFGRLCAWRWLLKFGWLAAKWWWLAAKRGWPSAKNGAAANWAAGTRLAAVW